MSPQGILLSANAPKGDGKRIVVQAEVLTAALLELERQCAEGAAEAGTVKGKFQACRSTLPTRRHPLRSYAVIMPRDAHPKPRSSEEIIEEKGYRCMASRVFLPALARGSG